jgi:septum formation protein
MLGVAYDLLAVDIPEEPPEGDFDPVGFAEDLAREKAQAAHEAREDADIIVTADTIVVHDGRVLGKPADLDDARRMLRELSGAVHEVVTAVTLLTQAGGSATFSVVSKVLMKELDEASIEEWVERGELLGCAGAYNIEGHLASVADTECYQNVAGLPLCHVWRALAEMPLAPPGLVAPGPACDASLGRECLLGREITGL